MKIKTIKRIKLEQPIQLYDITVPEYNNLCVKINDNHIVAHNSSSQTL